MRLQKDKKVNHNHRNIATEALRGVSEVSKQVEHVEHITGPQMRELAQAGNISSANLSSANMAGDIYPAPAVMPGAVGAIGGDVLQSNIVEDVLPIRVTRNTYNIPFSLPFIIFSPVNFIENYASLFAIIQTLPTGTTVAVSIINNNAYRFTYTKGVDVDTIDVSADFAVPYPVIQEMLKTDFLRAKGIKYTADTSDFDVQFAAFSLKGGKSTFQGALNTKSVPVSSFKRVDQNQNNIVNLDATIIINGRRYLALGMVTHVVGTAAKTISLDVFVTNYGSTVDFDAGKSAMCQ